MGFGVGSAVGALEHIPAPPPAGPGARFLCPLELEWIDGTNWKLTAGFDYMSDVLGRVVDVPAGFVTDFASTPRIGWSILPPTGPYGPAAAVHDYLYRTPGLASKRQADAVFAEAMSVLKVPPETIKTMYDAVVLFGASSYNGGLVDDVVADASEHLLPPLDSHPIPGLNA